MTASILLVDNDPSLIQVLGKHLKDMGQIHFATSGAGALEQARSEPPDLILLDIDMPDMDGFATCAALKALPELRDVPIVFVTSHHASDTEVRGFEVGAADFIHKPISEPILRARVSTQLRLKRMSDDLKRLADTDTLTQLANRRTFDRRLSEEWGRSTREEAPLALLMIDIDRFKEFNDRYGHPAGDACLRSVAQALHGALFRPSDLVARYGGEEFAVILPNTTREGAYLVAQRMLEAVLDLKLMHAGGVIEGIVSVCIGVACSDDLKAADDGAEHPPGTSRGAAPLLSLADHALYLAKRHGRARSWVA